MEEVSDRVKVLYICGTRRCGSTMLSRLLGDVEGFVNVGEMASYFLRQRLAGPCGCGARVEDCFFWRDFPASPAARLMGRDLIRIRRLPRMLTHSHAHSRSTGNFLAHADRLYRRIRDKTGASVIVDSSKSPAMAHALAQSAGLSVSVIHLIRSPAGVVGSRRHPKGYLQAASATQVLLEWWAYNLAAEFLAGRATHYWRIRYEDVVREPRNWVEGIAGAVAGRAVDCSFIVGNHAKVRVQHILGGNPDKLRGSDLFIQERDPGLSAWIAGPVYLLAAPLLLRYGLGRKPEGFTVRNRADQSRETSPAVGL